MMLIEDISETIPFRYSCSELPAACQFFADTLRYASPAAYASIQGSPDYPDIHGTVLFYNLSYAVLIQTAIEELPCSPAPCQSHFFGFHLHSGSSCAGTEQEPFALADGHYNPEGCPHPDHAGDFPPLLCNHGSAWSAFLTDRFQIKDIIGRVLILHRDPDDFTSQPSGNSGAMIACGVIYGTEKL